MSSGNPVVESLRSNAAPEPRLLAVVGFVGLLLLTGTGVFWPVGTTDYQVDVDATPVDAAAADRVVAHADLPAGARRAVERQVATPEVGLDRYRATAAELRHVQRYDYVSYRGETYAYEVDNDHDAGMAFVRGALVGMGALSLVYAALAYATDRLRPLTAVSGLSVPVAVAVALVGTYGADLLFGGPGNTLPTRDGGATYVLALAVVVSLGTLAARSRVGAHWLPVGILVLTAGFVVWEAIPYVERGAPVFVWLFLAILAGIALVAVLLPVLGAGYLLATPTDAPG